MTMFQNLHRSMPSAQTLKVQCGACRHLARLTAAEAKARFGPDATPADIRRRAKCRECGASGVAQAWI